MYGLIFDVDGVIADTEAVNARASIQVFDDLLGIKGVQRADFEAAVRDLCGFGGAAGLQGGDQGFSAGFDVPREGYACLGIVLSPFLELVFDAEQAAPEKLELEDVGFVAFGQAGGLEQDASHAVDGPEDGHGGRSAGPFSADDLTFSGDRISI